MKRKKAYLYIQLIFGIIIFVGALVGLSFLGYYAYKQGFSSQDVLDAIGVALFLLVVYGLIGMAAYTLIKWRIADQKIKREINESQYHRDSRTPSMRRYRS